MSVEHQTLSPRRFGRWDVAVQRSVTRIHTFFYRLTGGAIGGRMVGSRVLLLTTMGRKSGKSRTLPLFYLADGDRLVLVASNGGTARHPLWWLNLLAHPQARVQVGRRKLSMKAEQANPEERGRLWPLLTAMYPGYADYQKRAPREIPVVILSPSERSSM